MAELEGAREGDPVEEEWSVERVLDKRVSSPADKQLLNSTNSGGAAWQARIPAEMVQLP